MEVGRVEETEVAEGKVVVTWTSAMSTFMLKHLADVVASGARTSSGFKMMHYNACARALNDHCRQRMTGGQISNHHRTVKKKFAKIEQIKNTVSGALWDDDQCIIRLEHDMALTYINKHKVAAEYINKPIENYSEMQIIYGNRMATGKWAKGSSEPIGTDTTGAEFDEGHEEGDVASTGQSTNAGESSATKATKRAKTCAGDDEGLIGVLGRVGSELAAIIVIVDEKSAPAPPPPPADAIPDDLYETLQTMEGFNEAHIAHYYAFLVEYPKSAKAFMKMGYIGQLTWISRYIAKEFKD